MLKGKEMPAKKQNSENIFLSPLTQPAGCPFCGYKYTAVISDLRPSFFQCQNKDCPSHAVQLPLEDMSFYAQKVKGIIPLLVDLRESERSLNWNLKEIEKHRGDLRNAKEEAKKRQDYHREIGELRQKLKNLRIFNTGGGKNAPFEFQDPGTGDIVTVNSINTKRRAVARIGYLYYDSKEDVNSSTEAIRGLKKAIHSLEADIASLKARIEQLKSNKKLKRHLAGVDMTIKTMRKIAQS